MFELLETAGELVVGAAKCGFGLDAELARQVRDGEQQVAHLFFGTRGPKSKPAQVNHTGIYLGIGWFIHSSGYGVALAKLDGWYRSEYAWARNPLKEAGLA